MFSNKNIIKIFTLFILLSASFFISFGQETKPMATPEVVNETVDNEVLKIDTNLIQTGVTVLDKKGKFVEKLNQEDFELKVDGKPIKLSFFESVVGTQIVANQANKDNTKINQPVAATANERGRVILFVVDDLHLNAEGHIRTKKVILNFIENEIKPNDVMAVVSTTGKIGFLQQFTNDKEVLQEAVSRLNYNRNYSAADRMNPPMSEYEALLIDRLDPEVTNIFAQQIVREIPGYDLESAKTQVRSRASNILFQARTVTQNTLSVLEQAIRRSAQLSGRKTVFFLSDGFIIDSQNSDYNNRLQKITDAASRSNAVIYSFDVKGLEAGFPEGTSTLLTATGYRVQAGERFEVQDGMNAFAENTGGRFISNTNDLQTAVNKAFTETSAYYLLAWEPETEITPEDKLKKIEVSVKNRPDLQVKMQNGYFSQKVVAEKTNVATKTQTPERTFETQLLAASKKQAVQTDLPTSMVLNYLEMPNEGSSLTVGLQIKNRNLAFLSEADKYFAKVDFLGLIYNSEGKQEGFFRDRMTLSYGKNEPGEPDMLHNFQTKLKPGLYQVRVATRDVKSGLLGNAVQWIKIPDLSKKKLALSSLLLGETFNQIQQNQMSNVNNSAQISAAMNVDRKFSRNSNLRYLIFIYNAVNENKFDVTVQTQLFRDGKTLMDTQPRPLPANGQNVDNLFYAAEIPLSSLPIGKYEIQITVQDRLASQTLLRKVKFEVR
jgi:VWFA-related protein